jgi:hypothetical protein
MHIVAQWTGGNGVTYYIGDIFQYAGIRGSQTSLITSGAYGIVKLIITIIFAWASLIGSVDDAAFWLVLPCKALRTSTWLSISVRSTQETDMHPTLPLLLFSSMRLAGL